MSLTGPTLSTATQIYNALLDTREGVPAHSVVAKIKMNCVLNIESEVGQMSDLLNSCLCKQLFQLSKFHTHRRGHRKSHAVSQKLGVILEW